MNQPILFSIDAFSHSISIYLTYDSARSLSSMKPGMSANLKSDEYAFYGFLVWLGALELISSVDPQMDHNKLLATCPSVVIQMKYTLIRIGLKQEKGPYFLDRLDKLLRLATLRVFARDSARS